MNRRRRFRLKLMYIDWSRIASMGMVFLATVGLAWFIAWRISSGVLTSEVHSCHRLNIVRANDNRNLLADYKFDTLEVRLVQASLKRQTGNLARSAQQRQATGQFIAGLTDAAGAKQWIALTPCHRAVYSDFKPPHPIYFSQQLPPKTALHLGPQN